MSTWLITGCSTGLGRSLAEAVLDRGDNVVVTARDVTKVDDLAKADNALALSLDVTDHSQVAEVMRAAETRFGAVDVLVNNAGYGYRAAVEEGDDADVRRLFDTHFFGTVALVKAVLPGMRARRQGVIVNVSSIGARVRPPGSGYYAAAKAAVEGMSGSLRAELAPLGIAVVVVEPGAFRTDFAGRSLTQSAASIADYAETAGRRRKERDATDGTQPGDPARAAQAVITAVTSAAPPSLLLLGSDALSYVGGVLDAEQAELAEWRAVSASTDFPS